MQIKYLFLCFFFTLPFLSDAQAQLYLGGDLGYTTGRLPDIYSGLQDNRRFKYRPVKGFSTNAGLFSRKELGRHFSFNFGVQASYFSGRIKFFDENWTEERVDRNLSLAITPCIGLRLGPLFLDAGWSLPFVGYAFGSNALFLDGREWRMDRFDKFDIGDDRGPLLRLGTMLNDKLNARGSHHYIPSQGFHFISLGTEYFIGTTNRKDKKE